MWPEASGSLLELVFLALSPSWRQELCQAWTLRAWKWLFQNFLVTWPWFASAGWAGTGRPLGLAPATCDQRGGHLQGRRQRSPGLGVGVWAGCHAGVLGQRPGGFDRGGPGLGCFPVCKMNTWGESYSWEKMVSGAVAEAYVGVVRGDAVCGDVGL